MIISFDIDNTLIPYSNEFEVEHKGLLSKMIGAESLRVGTKELFKALENQGHQVWIYTTSLRSVFKLKKTFIAAGLSPARIINGHINQEVLKKHHCTASKNPKLFGIDLHVDDAPGVALEGEQYGFATFMVDPSDEDWVGKVLDRVK